MRYATRILLCIVSAMTFACGDSSPSSPTSNPSAPIPWSPYVGIHTTGEATLGYDAALEKLVAAGALQGARVGVDQTGQALPYVSRYASHGIELVGIVDNVDLFGQDIEGVMDNVLSRYYPMITTYQLGNELSTIISRLQPQLPNEAYMDRLRRAYLHIKDTHPDVTLITYSTIGAGNKGSQDLQELVRLGLRDIPPSRLIIGMNVYTDVALREQAAVRNRHLRNYRVWVLETGISNPGQHIGHVQEFYPRIRSELAAERIYWYVLWGGDGPPDVGFSLITRPQTANFIPSPLFTALTGGGQ